MNPLTPEQEAEFQARQQEFKEKYVALTEEYQCDFIAFPQLVPQQNMTFALVSSMQIVDKKYAPVPSNLAS